MLPGRPQYVPIDRFQANLRHLVSMVRKSDSEWYSPETRVILITPPPIIPEHRQIAQVARWKEFGSKGEKPLLDRDPENTKAYAQAVKAVGKELVVPTVDLFSAIIDAAGGDSPEQLDPYF